MGPFLEAKGRKGIPNLGISNSIFILFSNPEFDIELIRLNFFPMNDYYGYNRRIFEYPKEGSLISVKYLIIPDAEEILQYVINAPSLILSKQH